MLNHRADQPHIDNSLASKTLHQSHPRHGVLHFDQVVANYMQHLSMQGVTVSEVVVMVVGG